MFRRTHGWFVGGPGAVVGTTKYSEQNHNPKEKGFKLKEYSRLKSHESFSEYDSKTGITFVLALRPIGAVAWGSPLQLITTGLCSVSSQSSSAISALLNSTPPARGILCNSKILALWHFELPHASHIAQIRSIVSGKFVLLCPFGSIAPLHFVRAFVLMAFEAVRSS
jgi:hypothetical protein